MRVRSSERCEVRRVGHCIRLSARMRQAKMLSTTFNFNLNPTRCAATLHEDRPELLRVISPSVCEHTLHTRVKRHSDYVRTSVSELRPPERNRR
jgi:hypothetical protein